MARKVSKSTKRRLSVFGVLSIVCILYFLFSLFYSLYQIYELNREKHSLEVEYKELKEEAEQLQVEIEELNDPEYIARYARENYLYSKSGEYIIKLNDTEEELKKVNDELNQDYIVIGITTVIVLIFIILFRRHRKKSK